MDTGVACRELVEPYVFHLDPKHLRTSLNPTAPRARLQKTGNSSIAYF